MPPLSSFSKKHFRESSALHFSRLFMWCRNVAPKGVLFFSSSVSSVELPSSFLGVCFLHFNALVLSSSSAAGVRGRSFSVFYRLREEQSTLLASPTSSLSICSQSFSCEGGLRRSRHLLAAALANGRQCKSSRLPRSVPFKPTVSKKQTLSASTEKELGSCRSFRKKDVDNGEGQRKKVQGEGKVRRNKNSAVGQPSFSTSAGASSSSVASSPIRQYVSSAQMTPQELEERDIRAAVRHVLTQYFMQENIEKRKLKFAEDEKKHDEKERLALLERELKRQEEILLRQELEKSKKSSSSSSSFDGEKASGSKNESGFDSSLLQSSPSALIQMYANTILSAGAKLETSSKNTKGEPSKGGSPMWTMDELQRLHHHIRMKRRQEEKERRAEELSSSVGTNTVGGVLPVVMPSSFGFSSSFVESSPSAVSRTHGDEVASLGWRRSIPTAAGKSETISEVAAWRAEEAARESLRQRDALTGLSLQPDLSLYSVEKDIRLSSEHVVRTQRLERERYYRHLTSPSSSLMEDFTEEWGNVSDDGNRPVSSSPHPSREDAVGENEREERKKTLSSPLHPCSEGIATPAPHNGNATSVSSGKHTKVPLVCRKGEEKEWNRGHRGGNLHDRKTSKMECLKRSSSGVTRGVMKRKPMTVSDDSEEL